MMMMMVETLSRSTARWRIMMMLMMIIMETLSMSTMIFLHG